MPAHYWGAGWAPDGEQELRRRCSGGNDYSFTFSTKRSPAKKQNILLKPRGRGGAAHLRQQLSHLSVPVVSQAKTLPDWLMVKTCFPATYLDPDAAICLSPAFAS